MAKRQPKYIDGITVGKRNPMWHVNRKGWMEIYEYMKERNSADFQRMLYIEWQRDIPRGHILDRLEMSYRRLKRREDAVRKTGVAP